MDASDRLRRHGSDDMTALDGLGVPSGFATSYRGERLHHQSHGRSTFETRIVLLLVECWLQRPPGAGTSRGATRSTPQPSSPARNEPPRMPTLTSS